MRRIYPYKVELLTPRQPNPLSLPPNHRLQTVQMLAAVLLGDLGEEPSKFPLTWLCRHYLYYNQ